MDLTILVITSQSPSRGVGLRLIVGQREQCRGCSELKLSEKKWFGGLKMVIANNTPVAFEA